MDYITRFMGEKNTGIENREIFHSLFDTGANNNLCVIATKSALPEQDPMDSHAHNHFEFTIPLTHSPTLFIENNTFALPRRNVFPSNPGQVHGVAEKAPSHHLVAFQLDHHYLEATAFAVFGKRSVEFNNTPIPMDHQLEKMLNLFLIESNHLQTGSEFMLDNLSNMIAIHLLRTLESNIEGKETLSFRPSRKGIAKSIEFFHDHLDREFSLEQVAAVAEMSKYHFVRVFKEETGKTPYQYFTDIKMKKAVELLKTGKHTVTEVCFMSGFKNHSHFSRVFSRKVGMTPSDLMSRIGH